MKKLYLENKTKKHKVSAFRKIALSTTVALSALCMYGEAKADQFYINGNTLYWTGFVDDQSDKRFFWYIEQAKKAGVKIDTIVFKNSPGGYVDESNAIANYIRDNKINTVAYGGCYSGCATMFLAGVNRQIADYSYNYAGQFDGTVIAIHGSSVEGRIQRVEDQAENIKFYETLLGPDSEAVKSGRIYDAHTEPLNSQGFLRYYDSNYNKIGTAILCPKEDTSEHGNCINYTGVTALSDSIITTDKYYAVDDIYILKQNHSGVIENNWSDLLWYANDNRILRSANRHEIKDNYRKTGHIYSTIVVPEGITWDLDATQSALTIIADKGTINLNANARFQMAEMITAVRGGTINLNGGTLSRASEIYQDSVVTGSGVITKGALFFGGIFAPENIVHKSYDFEYFSPQSNFEAFREKKHRFTFLDVYQGARLRRNSKMLFNVSNNTNVAPYRLEESYSLGFVTWYDTMYDIGSIKYNAQLLIDPSSVLLLNIENGFYGENHVIPLVSTIVDNLVPDDSFAELCNYEVVGARQHKFIHCLSQSYGHRDDKTNPISMITADQDFINGKFETAQRFGDDEYSLDLTKEGAEFTPSDGSLISFTVTQTKDGIWLTAKESFTDISMFNGDLSGNRLGEIIRSEYKNPTSELKPLIGALQFSNAPTITRQASSLRGDGHSSLRLVHHNVIDQLSGVVQNSIQNPTQRVTVDKYLQPTDENNASQYDQSNKNTFWLSGFGRTGSVDTYKRVFGLDYDNIGTAGGLSRNLSDKLLIGASVGYSRIKTNSNSENYFQAESEALSASVYGNISHNRGYISSNLGFAKISNETLRSVGEINGLEGVIKSDYDVNAIFGHLESGFDFHRGNNKVTLLAPVLRYTNISETKFNDEGSLNHKLGGTLEDYTSFKAGIGLHAESNIVKSNWNLTPFARVVWQHEFMDSDARSLNHFAYAKSQSFHSVSRPLGTETVDWNIGMRSSTFSNRVNLSLEYQGQSLSGASSHGVQAGVQFKF